MVGRASAYVSVWPLADIQRRARNVRVSKAQRTWLRLRTEAGVSIRGAGTPCCNENRSHGHAYGREGSRRYRGGDGTTLHRRRASRRSPRNLFRPRDGVHWPHAKVTTVTSASEADGIYSAC